MRTNKTNAFNGGAIGKAILLTFTLAAVTSISLQQAGAQSRVQAGVLVCASEGDWGATINSSKAFQCTYSSTAGEVRGEYSAQIQKFREDAGKSGNTVLIWLVSGPAERIGENYEPGGLEDTYVAVDSDSPQSMELSADALVGVGPRSFALQPVSVQFQTGLSVARGVNTLTLRYIGPKSASVSPSHSFSRVGLD